MKRIITVIISLIYAATLHASETEQQPAIDAAWFKAHYVKNEYMIPMRDGIRLYTAVYTPKNRRSHHPILLTRTPYGCGPYGRRNASFWQQAIFEEEDIGHQTDAYRDDECKETEDDSLGAVGLEV